MKTMTKKTRKKLEAAGWKVGTVAELLNLSKEDEAFVELKVALAKSLRERRERSHLTQTQVARRVGSSQPRVAFMEAAHSTVSLDLLIRTLLATGTSLADIATIVRSAAKRSAA
jgi:predicted XRE-type DNA-binding protein